MTRLYSMLLFAMLVLVVPAESAGQNGELAKLKEVRILVENLNKVSMELGLNEEDIKNHVRIFTQQSTTSESVGN